MGREVLTDHERELVDLVDLLARVGKECDVLTRTEGGLKREALGFAFKLTGHAASALTLLRDKSSLVPEGHRFLDRTSVLILARAGWEAFLRRSRKQQREFLLEHGTWRPGFPTMAKNAGLAKAFAEDHYSYLCDHAHSGWFSIAYSKGSLTEESEKQLRQTVAISLGIATANTITGLRSLFQRLQPIADLDARRVKYWVAQGQGRDEER